MTKRPTTVPTGSMMTDAVEIMAERKISEIARGGRRGQAGRADRHHRHRGLVSRGKLRAASGLPRATAAGARLGQPPRPKNPAFRSQHRCGPKRSVRIISRAAIPRSPGNDR